MSPMPQSCVDVPCGPAAAQASPSGLREPGAEQQAVCVVPMWMAEEDPSAPRAVVQGTPGSLPPRVGVGR